MCGEQLFVERTKRRKLITSSEYLLLSLDTSESRNTTESILLKLIVGFSTCSVTTGVTALQISRTRQKRFLLTARISEYSLLVIFLFLSLFLKMTWKDVPPFYHVVLFPLFCYFSLHAPLKPFKSCKAVNWRELKSPHVKMWAKQNFCHLNNDVSAAVKTKLPESGAMMGLRLNSANSCSRSLFIRKFLQPSIVKAKKEIR